MGITSRDELLNSSPYGVFLLDVPNLVPSSQTLKLSFKSISCFSGITASK